MAERYEVSRLNRKSSAVSLRSPVQPKKIDLRSQVQNKTEFW